MCVFLTWATSVWYILKHQMCRTRPKWLFILHTRAHKKRQGIKTSHAMLAALLTTSQFPRIHFDVWIMEESRLHTHTRSQGHRVYPTVGKWSVIENSWTPAGRNGERKTPRNAFVQLSLNICRSSNTIRAPLRTNAATDWGSGLELNSLGKFRSNLRASDAKTKPHARML